MCHKGARRSTNLGLNKFILVIFSNVNAVIRRWRSQRVDPVQPGRSCKTFLQLCALGEAQQSGQGLLDGRKWRAGLQGRVAQH